MVIVAARIFRLFTILSHQQTGELIRLHTVCCQRQVTFLPHCIEYSTKVCLWNINNSITNWHWWFSYLLLIFSSITKCKIIIKLDHSVAGCRLLECNMDVVIIYRGKFSVSRKIRMQVLCHTGTFPSTGGSWT